ncbi:hypothetical protein DHW03_01675 [Pedobacter yonginense]|uniref:Uncharacterized protein n=1 Tax=Pedobacter yonginense TaxID=651869 RepID=A0A317ETW0_9SPHI|nr:hypothetical protein [Pedobacter yonginense]PWS28588.1 hypothetical protein DHW03_01675 [Pedobacter yonginense]
MKFIYKNQINICIAFGLLGFFFSVLLLTKHNGVEISGGKRNSPYGEIYLSNKDSLVRMVLCQRISKLKAELNKYEKTDLSKNAEAKKYVEEARLAIKNTYVEINTLSYGNSGKDLKTYSKYLYPDKKAYLSALNDASWKNDDKYSIAVPLIILDDCKLLTDYPAKYTGQKLLLKQHKRALLMSFIDDYPQFGLWIVLSIAQMTLWFLMLPLLTGNVLNLQNKLPAANGIGINGILKSLTIPVLAFVVFAYCFYLRLADDYVINDNHFFQNYNSRLEYYATTGYLVSAYCFATYIFLSRQIDLLNQNFISPGTLLVQNINDGYLALKKAFDNAFLASAIILSLMVLWVGITINAVNSTESMAFFSLMNAKPGISNDFTYLMGLLHSCLLLIFYLPVKLKFDSLEITQPQSGAGSPVKTVFSSLAESLKTLLITASPILAGFAQELFKLLLKP